MGHHHVLLPGEKYFDGPSRAVDHGVRRLIKDHPELAPAKGLLPSLAHISDAVTRVSSLHDPTTSCRLAVGEAWDVNYVASGHRTIPIMAVVAGHASDAVRLFTIQERQLGWEDGRRSSSTRLNMPYVAAGDEGWWKSNHGKVQQICFASDQGRGASWLAVRQLNSTTVLWPLYRRTPRFPTFPGRCKQIHPRSHLDPNPLVTLSIQETGGVPHADVAFNPWCHRRLAVLDRNGHWTVWRIEAGTPEGLPCDVQLDRSGCVYDPTSKQVGTNNADGWGTVCWAGDLNTILVFTRRHVAVLDVRIQPPAHLQTPDLRLAGTSGWILDAQRSPVNESHMFTVTTFQIFWLEVIGADRARSAESLPSGCRVLLAWRHSRHEEDTSLRLSIVNHQDC